jgi:hypothetical protein
MKLFHSVPGVPRAKMERLGGFLLLLKCGTIF